MSTPAATTGKTSRATPSAMPIGSPTPIRSSPYRIANARYSASSAAITATAMRTLTPAARPLGTRQPEIEQLVEPDDDAPSLAHGAQPQQDARLVRRVGVGVVQHAQGLPDAAEDDLLARGDARMPEAVDRHARDLLSPRPLVGVRSGDRPGLEAGPSDELGRADRGARRRVDLALVVALDDLDELEPRCRRAPRTPSRAPNRARSSGPARHRAARRPGTRRCSVAMRSAVHPEVPTSTGMPRSSAAATMSGETAGTVTSKTMSAPSMPSIASPRPDRGVQLEIVCLGDQTLCEAAHPARRADHGDPADHGLHARRRSLAAVPRYVPTPVDDPVAAELLDEYFASRALGFTGGVYRRADPDPAAFVPPAGIFLVVFDDDEAAAGCGGVRMLQPRSRRDQAPLASQRVPRPRLGAHACSPSSRCVQRASAHGSSCSTRTRPSTAAQSLYRTSGYDEIEPYNDNPNATHWFEKRLPGEE